MTKKQNVTEAPGYPIGVVSRLTGIHPETLRMWERRYGIVQPDRTGRGNRLYAEDDVHRLALVKTLVDAGHQISIVAPMTTEQLRARLEATSPRGLKRASGDARPRRVIVLGKALPTRLAAAKGKIGDLEVVGAFQDEAQLKAAAPSLAADVLIVEYATVQEETPANVRALLTATGAQRAVVVYGFAMRQALMKLEAAGVVCLRAPADVAEIQDACRAPGAGVAATSAYAGTAQAETVAPPIFTPEQLARIAVRAPVVACECPHHLVELINSMAAFETYSRECQNRNVDDAEIHAFLFVTAGRARALLETALKRVAEFEGIELT